ncbi:MAG TPA: YihY/virulence factor BrkB family protein [Actinomycetota bacterium]|nr:YihY/virulence factor BrkB family protein [Actinomycetota bacterium]
MHLIERTIRRVDRAQQRRRPLAVAVAVLKKFGDDQGGHLAALLAYYAFLSLFPLLAVASTLLARALPGNPELREAVLGSALRNLPLVGETLQRDAPSLDGSGVALVVALAVALWAGLGAIRAFEHALNTIWNVPYRRRPSFLGNVARAAAVLALLAALVLVGAGLAAAAQAAGGPAGTLAGWSASVLVNVAGLLVAYRVLTGASLPWSAHVWGAVAAGTAWTVLLAAGARYVAWQVSGAGRVYGTFALVIGLLAWLFLSAQVALLGAEINVVRAARLWPRSLVQPPLTDADRRALVRYVEEAARRPEVVVDADVPSGSPP